MKYDKGGGSFLMALGIITASALGNCDAEAQHSNVRRWEGQLLQLEAKVSINEASDSYYDLALIHQVTEGHGADARERALWLRSHSPCVSGVLSQDEARRRPGNCRWSRNLHVDGRRPRGWDRALHGVWNRLRPRWQAHLAKVRAFVSGEDTYRPCEETPVSWDGVRYGRETVEARGYRVLDCDVPYTRVPGEEGLHNFAVVRASRQPG